MIVESIKQISVQIFQAREITKSLFAKDMNVILKDSYIQIKSGQYGVQPVTGQTRYIQ